MGETTYNYMKSNPPSGYSKYASGYALPSGGASYGVRGSGSFQQPTTLSPAIRAYEDIANMYSAGSGEKGPTITVSGYDPSAGNDWTLYDPKKTPSYGGRVGGGGGQRPADRFGRPQPKMQAIPYPEMPALNLPEYKPPEEDPNVYKKARQMAIAPGLREARQRTREAIMSSYALDNPNQRSEFIRNAIRGYGEGLEGIASQASKEARQEAGRKRQEQLQLYQAQYAAKQTEAMTNYQAEINKLLAEYAQQQAMAQQAYDWQSQYGSPEEAKNVVGAPRGYITGIGGRQIPV